MRYCTAPYNIQLYLQYIYLSTVPVVQYRSCSWQIHVRYPSLSNSVLPTFEYHSKLDPSPLRQKRRGNIYKSICGIQTRCSQTTGSNFLNVRARDQMYGRGPQAVIISRSNEALPS